MRERCRCRPAPMALLSDGRLSIDSRAKVTRRVLGRRRLRSPCRVRAMSRSTALLPCAMDDSTAPGEAIAKAARAQRPAAAAASSRRSSPQKSSLPIATVGMPVTPRASASAV